MTYTVSVLVVTELQKAFQTRSRGRVRAVDGLSFSVEAGEVYALLGPNGAGKTTTLRILATLMRADAGTIQVDGIDHARQPLAVRQRLAYVPAEAGLPEKLTPREVVTLFARIQGVRDARRRTATLLEELGASEYADALCSDLSTGMKRRVVLARALIHEPKVLLLDEPTDGLDVPGRRDVLDMVRSQAASGRAVIISSHIMGEVERTADRLGMMRSGKMVVEGTLSEVLAFADTDDLADAFVTLLTQPS